MDHANLHSSQVQEQNSITCVICMQVFLNPQAELPDLPLKSFYRYSLPEVSMSGANPVATFLRGCMLVLCCTEERFAWKVHASFNLVHLATSIAARVSH